MSFALTGRYGLQQVYREWDGQKFSRDNLWDVGNRDGGTAGNTNENWNPHNTLKVHANFSTPSEFGPNMGQFHPLGSWHLNVYTLWAGGQQFTYHSPGDLSSEPLNQTWKPFNRTNIRLSKRIPMTSGLNAELTMDVINLFNNKRLRRPGGDDLERYMENGELPIHPQTKETLEWTIYDFSTLPREIFFGVRFLF
jgi:hypothetical protein